MSLSFIEDLAKRNDALDQCWEAVNALGTPSTTEGSDAVNGAVDLVLGQIERLGGMDPLVRKQMRAETARLLATSARLARHQIAAE